MWQRVCSSGHVRKNNCTAKQIPVELGVVLEASFLPFLWHPMRCLLQLSLLYFGSFCPFRWSCFRYLLRCVTRFLLLLFLPFFLYRFHSLFLSCLLFFWVFLSFFLSFFVVCLSFVSFLPFFGSCFLEFRLSDVLLSSSGSGLPPCSQGYFY